MPDAAPWLTALRRSQDRFADLVAGLDPARAEDQSYDTEWSIGQVASHLGSGAEIFQLFAAAGLGEGDAPGGEAFAPIWDRWNAKSAADQVRDAVGPNEELVARLEGLDEEQRAAFELDFFGTTVDLAAFVGMRLGEHAVHSWDIAVALDPAATVAPDAVDLLVDRLGAIAARTGQAIDGGPEVVIETTDPVRHVLVTTAQEVALSEAEALGEPDLRLPAEALLRLVYGRLDPDHTPADLAGNEQVALLRGVFPGL
jgi:uncharacterized protein (TIGR03083 family)